MPTGKYDDDNSGGSVRVRGEDVVDVPKRKDASMFFRLGQRGAFRKMKGS